MFCARLPVAERQESLGRVLGALWRKGGEGWGAAQRPRCVTPWKGYALTSAPHCPCSACLRFNHIQIFITIWIKPWFFFMSTQQESSAGDAGDTSPHAADRQSAKVCKGNINWLSSFSFFFSPFFSFRWWPQNCNKGLLTLICIYLFHSAPLLVFKPVLVQGPVSVDSCLQEGKKKRKLKSIS